MLIQTPNMSICIDKIPYKDMKDGLVSHSIVCSYLNKQWPSHIYNLSHFGYTKTSGSMGAYGLIIYSM